MSIAAWKAAKSAKAEAEKYLNLIGKTTTQTTVAAREGVSATAGELTKFRVETEICFQPYDGAQNYHRCKAFDDALTTVLRKKWSAIRDEAMAYLEHQEALAAADAADELRAMLAEAEKHK